MTFGLHILASLRARQQLLTFRTTLALFFRTHYYVPSFYVISIITMMFHKPHLCSFTTWRCYKSNLVVILESTEMFLIEFICCLHVCRCLQINKRIVLIWRQCLFIMHKCFISHAFVVLHNGTMHNKARHCYLHTRVCQERILPFCL
jgi:hypothetical protein